MTKHIQLQARNIFLLSALLLGFLAGNYAHLIKDYIIYLLTIMMTLSLQSIPSKIFTPNFKLLKPIFTSIILNYFLFSIILFFLVFIIIPYEKEIYIGFLLIAISPPGVVIVPFALRMNADTNWATIGVIGAYLFLLILFPITLLFLDFQFDITEVLKLLVYSVLLPIILSRVLRMLPVRSFNFKYQGRIIDICFFILIYVVIGINNSLLINNFKIAVYPILVFFLILFPTTMIFIYILKRRNVIHEKIINRALMFSVKNNGFSAVTALTLFGTTSAIPSVALSVVLLIYLIIFPSIIPRVEEKASF